MAESFHEYRHVRQSPGEPTLRWFLSDYFELFVWFGEDGHPCVFRLCYDRGFQEHAITWECGKPWLRHEAVDDGDSSRGFTRSPVLVAPKHAISSRIADRFARSQGEVPADLRELVLTELRRPREANG